MNNSLILVNEEDEEIGYCEKMDAHRKEYLHRAFSLFIYHKTDHKMLLHKRDIGEISFRWFMDKLMLFASEVWREFDGCCDPQNKGRTRPGYSSYADELKEVGKIFIITKNIVPVLKTKLIMSFCLQWKTANFRC